MGLERHEEYDGILDALRKTTVELVQVEGTGEGEIAGLNGGTGERGWGEESDGVTNRLYRDEDLREK